MHLVRDHKKKRKRRHTKAPTECCGLLQNPCRTFIEDTLQRGVGFPDEALRKRQKARQFPAAFGTKMHGIEAKKEGEKR